MCSKWGSGLKVDCAYSNKEEKGRGSSSWGRGLWRNKGRGLKVDEGREQGGSRGLQGEAESNLKGAVRLKEVRAEA